MREVVAVLVAVLSIGSICGAAESPAVATSEATITREFLLAHRFVEDAERPGFFSLKSVRVGDAAKDLGFELGAMLPTLNQSIATDIRSVQIKDRHFIVESRVRPANGFVSGTLREPDALCDISVSLIHPVRTIQQTTSRPIVCIKQVSVPADKTNPLEITVEFASDGDTPIAVTMSQFHVVIATFDESPIFRGKPEHTKRVESVVTAHPGKPVEVKILTTKNTITQNHWSNLPIGTYRLAVELDKTKPSGFDYEWIHGGRSEGVPILLR